MLRMPLHHATTPLLPVMNLLRMQGAPILQQLHLEERLLRCHSSNWCILNLGTPNPTVVMGVSGKPSELIHLKSVIQDQVPVIRRFTGGGTVIVDQHTIFVTFICNREALPALKLYPQPIMSWTGSLYQDVFHDFGKFNLRENDYVFDKLKFGGNAQSITKNRWIHHTSFLWDYDARNMEYLKHPSRTPKYRLERSHVEFLCKMRDIIPSKLVFIEKTLKSLQKHFVLQDIQPEDINGLNLPYAPSSRLLNRKELEQELLSTNA